jgi:transposase
MLEGERIDKLKEEFEISDYTLYRWRRQARIDAGQSPGAKGYEFDPLLQARRRRIKELERELKATKAASALFEEGGAGPKEVPGCPRTKQPGLHRTRFGCEIVGLDRSTYYNYKFYKPTDRDNRHLLLSDVIAEIHERSRGTYGRLRIRGALELEHGLIVDKKQIAKIMKELGIQGLPGPKKGTKNLKNLQPASLS